MKVGANTRFNVGATCFLALNLSGYLFAIKYIHDSAWFEMFLSVLWLPTGFISYLVAHGFAALMIRFDRSVSKGA